MYGLAATARRRCTRTTKAGVPCRAWAMWGDPKQRCNVHAGRVRGPQLVGYTPPRKARYVPCRCAAYGWPHRPAAGLCRWPDPPTATSATPTGTHRPGFRWRERLGRVTLERR